MAVIFLRTTKELHEALKDQAKKEKLSMTDLAAKILKEGLKKKK